MSLPLTRRIARAALLLAAGAAPVVGAAGSASALDHGLAPTGALGSVTALDTATANGTVDSASQTATGVVGEAGGEAVAAAAPTAGKAVDAAGRTATPLAQEATGDAADSAGRLVTRTTENPTQGTLGGLPLGD
ncbi:MULTISPECIES: ATP-binding protein [unclassified Streptomyces]|uniref:ATP-binding protein n=1 Tax=unclassified Streptomyces TaxID=2593676 RepID=UPI00368839C2